MEKPSQAKFNKLAASPRPLANWRRCKGFAGRLSEKPSFEAGVAKSHLLKEGTFDGWGKSEDIKALLGKGALLGGAKPRPHRPARPPCRSHGAFSIARALEAWVLILVFMSNEWLQVELAVFWLMTQPRQPGS